MEKLITLAWRCMIIMALIGIPVSVSHGQSEAQAADDLRIERQEDATKAVIVDSGTKLKVWTSDGRLYTGALKAVTDSSFVLGTKEIAFSKTERIKFDKGEGGRMGGLASVIFGLLGGLVGLGLSLLGLKVIDDAPSGTADGCAYILLGALLLVLGIALGVVGIIFIIAGIVAFAVGNAVARNFNLEGKWRLKRQPRA
ncbi:MAG TPA: hypothetical protein VHS96_12270 [Bacteroidia bacterium]|nr:hypothetical protein [Bacteroidia bacterium]